METILQFIAIYLLQPITIFIISLKLSSYKINKKKKQLIKTILFTMLLMSIFYLGINYIDKLVRICIFPIIISIYIKVLFRKNLLESTLMSIACYCIILISEIIYVFIIASFKILNLTYLYDHFFTAIMANLSTAIFSIFICVFFHKKISEIIQFCLKKIKIIITVIIIVSSTFTLYIINSESFFKLGKTTFINSIIIIIIIYYVCYLLLDNKRKEDKIKEYDTLFEYFSLIETLLRQHQKINHENKNQLIAIKSMTRCYKVQDFIDEILKEQINYNENLIASLINLPYGGLKGLFYYKIDKMIKNKLKVNINISVNVQKYKFKSLSATQIKNLVRVFGILIDNAYENSLKSDKKEVTIEMYYTKEKLMFIISNSFNGEIDIEKIKEHGYTSNGLGRGIGLSILDDIIKNEKMFSYKVEIIKDYFYSYFTFQQK